MAYEPLTQDQYKAASAKFSPDQILQFEQKRKASEGAPGWLQQTGSAIKNMAGAVGNWAIDQLPAIGGVAGGVIGGIIGTPADIISGPAGTIVGASAGAATGGALGETLKEKIQGKSLSASNIATQGLVMGATEAVGGPIFKVAGSVIKAGGETLAEMFIPKTSIESGIMQAYKAKNSLIDRIMTIAGGWKKTEAPTTAAKTAFTQGLVGTESMIGIQAKRAQTKIWDNVISPTLKQSDTKVNMWDFFKEAENKIASETTDPTRQKALLNALESIQKDFKEPLKKGANIGLYALQSFKEGWAEFVPEKAYKGESISGAVNDVRNTLADMSRQKIYDSLGANIKQAYIDYGNLNTIKALGQKAGTGTPIPSGGTFTGLKSIFDSLAVPIGTIGGQTIYKVGQGVRLVGAPGARTVRDILAGTVVNSDGTQESTPNQSPSTVTTPTGK